MTLLSQGRAPLSRAPVLAGAGMVALLKPAGKIRPIAVGKLLRRLLGKYLMALVREDARFFFWPAQVGGGIKAGAGKAVDTVRAWLERQNSSCRKILVKLDFANTFNYIGRRVALH